MRSPSAETTARHGWSDQERTRAKARAQVIITGTPDRVHAELTALAEAHDAEEITVNTLSSDPEDRLASYRLLAERFAA